MNIFITFLGGPGEAHWYVESRGTKVSRGPHHTGDLHMYNKETMDNKATRSPEISGQQVQKPTPHTILTPPPLRKFYFLKMLQIA